MNISQLQNTDDKAALFVAVSDRDLWHKCHLRLAAVSPRCRLRNAAAAVVAVVAVVLAIIGTDIARVPRPVPEVLAARGKRTDGSTGSGIAVIQKRAPCESEVVRLCVLRSPRQCR